MGKKRTKNKHLPARVYYKHGAYWFVDLKNKWHKLGKSLAEAMTHWSKNFDVPLASNTMGAGIDRYEKEVLSQKAETTRRNQRYNLGRIRRYFRYMIPSTVTPVDIYKYLDIVKEGSGIFAANKDLSVLSDMFSSFVRWGLVAENPCRDVERFSEPKRERAVNQEEVDTFKNCLEVIVATVNANPHKNRNDLKQKECCINLMLAIDFYSTTGLRKFDLLRIMRTQVSPEGLKVRINKVNKYAIFEWKDFLRNTVDRALAVSAYRKSLYLVSQHNGHPYSRDGFYSLWRRYMQWAVKFKILKQAFTINDLRSKAADDAREKKGKRYAQELLVHSQEKTTDNYLRRPIKVEPLN